MTRRTLTPRMRLTAALCGLALAGAAAAQPAERNTRHALIIAVGEYSDPQIPTLHGVKYDVDSARRMAQAMAVPASQITVLRDAQATAANIRAAVAALDRRVADGDRVFVYYSGHGTRWYDESVRRDGCTEGLLAHDGQALTNVEFSRMLAPIARRSDKMLVFYDACFSGGVATQPFTTRSLRIGGASVVPKFTRAGAPEMCSTPTNFRTRDLSQALQRSAALPENVVHVAASRPDEVSFDNPASGGMATTAWRDCLLGRARDLDGSGAVTVDEVTRCAQDGVTRALKGQPGITGQQMTVAGNKSFVPAWISAAFTSAPASAPAAAAAQAPPPAPAPSPPPVVATLPSTVPGAGTGPVASLPSAPAAVTLPTVPTLAAGPAQAVKPATPSQILAELHRQRDGARKVAVVLKTPRLRIGKDALALELTAQRDGYLYLALAGSDGKSLYLLYPNELAVDNRVRAGQKLRLPGADWEIVAGGPAGTETILAIVTDAPRDLAGLSAEKTGPFMKTLLDGEGRARLQQILSNGTPATGCGGAGGVSCSDAFGAALVTVRTVP